MKNFQNKTKIIKVSMQLRAVARLTLIFWTLGLAIFLVGGFTSLTHGGNSRSYYLTVGGIVEMILAMVVSLNFFRFFDRLKNGALFDEKTVSRLHAAGQWWLVYWAADFLFGIIGNHWLGAKMTLSFSQLFASLTVIFVAWLLREAQDLQDEQQLTV